MASKTAQKFKKASSFLPTKMIRSTSDTTQTHQNITSQKEYETKPGITKSVHVITEQPIFNVRSSEETTTTLTHSSGASLNESQTNFEINECEPQAGKDSFERLPKHLTKSGLLVPAARTLMDSGFIRERIKTLGILRSADLHLSDCRLLEKYIIKSNKMHFQMSPVNKNTTNNGSGKKHTCWKEADVPPDPTNYKDNSSHSIPSKYSESCMSLRTSDRLDERQVIVECFKKFGKSLMKIVKRVNMENECNDDSYLTTLRESQYAFFNFGSLLHDRDWLDEAQACYKRSSIVFTYIPNEVLCDGDNLFIAKTLTKMGDIEGKRGNLKKAFRMYQLALEKNLPLEEKNETSKIFNKLGDTFGAKGDLDKALEYYQNALFLQKSYKKITSEDIAETLHNIGVVYRHQNQLELALETYKEALNMMEKSDQEENHELFSRILNNIGSIYRRRGEYDKAMEFFSQVLELRRKTQGDYHPSVGLTLIHYAKSLRLKGDMAEALKFYDEAMK